MLWERRSNTVYSSVEEAILSMSGQTEEALLHPPTFQPSSIPGIVEAGRVIFQARSEGRHAYIVGDYDADGITSTAILSRLFKFLHIEHTTIIPKRLSDGYGVSECHVAGIQDSLIVTVDNGIAAGEILDKAAGRNNLIVVIDHHLPGEGVPASADVIIDPHMFPSACGFNDYCGAGLAYKLACHMLQGVNVPARLSNDLLVLAGIGTIADSMPLIQDNRSLVMRALGVINTHFDLVSPGLSNLLAECGTPGTITAHTLSYKLVPLINAPGRMYDAGGSSSLKVLVCEDHELGAAYVTKMVAINQRRRQVVSGYIEQACKEAQNQSSPIVVYMPGLQEGLLGIVAGRLLDTFCTTSVVLSNSRELGVVKGSVRAAQECHAKEMLDSVSTLLTAYGGHSGAAGLTLPSGAVEAFTEQIKQASGASTVRQCLYYDVDMPEGAVVSAMHSLNKFEPLGCGVRQPTCVIRGVHVRGASYVGADKNTLKLSCDGFSVIAFGKADLYRQYGEPEVLDIIGTIEENNFRGNTSIQVVVEDFKPCIF